MTEQQTQAVEKSGNGANEQQIIEQKNDNKLEEQPATEQKAIIWWKDIKFLIGIALVLLSIILGFFGKGLSIVKFYEPLYLITGLSIWAFSWALLFLGAFLVGWETAKMIQYRIQQQVKKTAKITYSYTKELPKKGYNYTKDLPKKGFNYSKELHKKGVDKILKTSKAIAGKIKL